MNKAVIILTGTPSGKSKFHDIALKHSWIWDVNPKNWLADVAKRHLYWSAEERDEQYHKTLANFYKDANEMFDYETHYIDNLLKRFRAFDKESMIGKDETGNTKIFSKFLMVIHGISKELTEKLQDDEGAIQLHITSRALNTNIKMHDLEIYEDDATFEQDVVRIIEELTENKKEKTSNE